MRCSHLASCSKRPHLAESFRTGHLAASAPALPARPGHSEKLAVHFSAIGWHLEMSFHIGQVATLAKAEHLAAEAPALCEIRGFVTGRDNKKKRKKNALVTFPAKPGHFPALDRAGHL